MVGRQCVVRYSTNGKERDTIHCYKGSKVKKGKL